MTHKQELAMSASLYFNEYFEDNPNREKHIEVLKNKIKDTYPHDKIDFLPVYTDKGMVYVSAVIDHPVTNQKNRLEYLSILHSVLQSETKRLSILLPIQDDRNGLTVNYARKEAIEEVDKSILALTNLRKEMSEYSLRYISETYGII